MVHPGKNARPQPVKRLAYVVSRFPHVSETFIVRELDAVSSERGLHAELFSLFRSTSSTVHPASRPWVPRLRRPDHLASLRGLTWWLVRRPLRMLSSTGLVVRAHLRRPRTLIRALVTMPIASANARTMSRLGVEHVHAHYATYPALAAWLCQRLTGIPYSFTAHAHDIFVDRSHLARKVADARFVVAISDYNRRSLEALDKGSTGKVQVVRCGIDPDCYPYRPRGPRRSGLVRALCVASLQEYKGHRVLLDALAGGGAQLERVRLELVGEGPLRASLEKQALALGLFAQVRFRGALTEPEVTAALEAADLFVLPSIVAADGQMEGIPVALMEALACGVPSVATRLSAVPELVRDGHTGILAEPGDVQSLREALLRTLSDPAAARGRAEAGRRLVESEFDLKSSARRLECLFSGQACDA